MSQLKKLAIVATIFSLLNASAVGADDEDRGATLPSLPTLPAPFPPLSDQRTTHDAAPASSAEVLKLEEKWLPKINKGKPEERADAANNLADALFALRQYDKAEKYIRLALDLLDGVQRPKEFVATRIALAIVLGVKRNYSEALAVYESALADAEKNNLTEYMLIITDSIGTLCLQSEKYDEAQRWFQKAFDLAASTGKVTTQIISLLNQATLARKLGNRDQALDLLSKALELSEKTDSGRDVAHLLSQLAGLQHDMGQHTDSIATYKKAAEIFKQELETDAEALAYLNMGETSYELRDIHSAQKFYMQGMQALKDEPPSKLFVSLLTGLGTAEADLGNFAAAEKHHKLAVEIARKLQDNNGELTALLQLGNDYLLRGNPEAGLHQLLEGEKLTTSSSSLTPQCRGGYLVGVGRCYKELGQTEPALKYYSEALRLFSDLNDKNSQAQVLTSIAVLHFDNSNLKEAKKSYAEARKIFESIDDRRNLAIIDYNEAQLKLNQMSGSEAITLYKSALQNLKGSGDKVLESMVIRGLGLAELSIGNPQKAIPYFQESLKLAEKSNSIEALWDSNLGLGKCYRALGSNDLAVAHLKKATELVERERAQLTRDSFKTFNLDFRKMCFTELLDLYVQLNKPYEALQVAEQGRARAFLDMLSSRKAGKLEMDTFTAPQATKADAAASNAMLVAGKAEPGSRAITVIPRASQIFAASAVSPVNANAPDIAEIKTLVQNSRSTVIEYYLLPNKLLVWIINPDTEIKMLPPISVEQEALRKKIQEAHNLITSQPKNKAELEALSKSRETLLKELYLLVFAPIEPHLPRDPESVVTIVPHGAMFSIPFAALIAPDGSYLIEKHTLAYTPAIGVWRATQNLDVAAAREQNRLLAFGNPITESIAFLGKLPYAEKEVQNIASLFGKENSVIKIGQDATKKTFAELAPQFSDIHLATHGLVDEEHPMQSSLVLAPTSSDDGLLSVKEIMSLKDLKARLVVLSACQTGRGKITGDGVVGLSRAFIIAGTPSVMVSQWNVDDIMTEFQMKQFYKAYLAGSSKSKALREAQLATIKFMEGGDKPAALRANPRYWAAFQLMGQAM